MFLNSPKFSKLLNLQDREACDNSPFAQVGNNLQLSSGQLESYLRAEVSCLRMNAYVFGSKKIFLNIVYGPLSLCHALRFGLHFGFHV